MQAGLRHVSGFKLLALTAAWLSLALNSPKLAVESRKLAMEMTTNRVQKRMGRCLNLVGVSVAMVVGVLDMMGINVQEPVAILESNYSKRSRDCCIEGLATIHATRRHLVS